MRVELPSGAVVWHIGDPHLGRRFETGVPSHRRGERERRQLERFKAELNEDCDINVCVGDLFDHPQVGIQTVLDAVDAYEEAAEARPDTFFIAMAGNHDRSRNLAAVGAWELFKRLIGDDWDNIRVVDTPQAFTTADREQLVVVPWQWDRTALEQIEPLPTEEEVTLVIGHWDLESYGGSTDHLAPTKAIMERFPNAQITTGHYHLAGDYKVDGIDVVCTGSLEPYTHAEDPEGELYVTLTLEQLAETPEETLRDKAVRILLRDGDELPVGLDCYALTGKRIADDADGPDLEHELGAFDWGKILDKHLAEVPTYVREFIDDRMVAHD